MKKAIATFLISATALGGSLAYAHAQENTSGSTLPSANPSILKDFKPFGGKQNMKFRNVEETRTNIENGVKITKTSTDAEVVKQLQAEQEAPKPRGNDDFMTAVTVSKVSISNGVEITLTSSDATVVKQLQEGPKAHAPREHLPMNKVTMTKENLANGVKITQTSTDDEIVAKLQSEDGPFRKKPADRTNDVTVSKENIENGVVVTLTSSNTETVSKLQNPPAMGERKDPGFPRGKKTN